jgi:NADH-quinone oxidoreductase subunit N
MIPSLLPLIVLAGTVVLVMLVVAFVRNHRLTLTLTMAGLAAAFGLLFMAAPTAPRPITALLLIDRYALFYTGLSVAASGAVALVAFSYLEKRGEPPEEFYLLLLLATLGSAVLVSSNHFASFFLGLEILSVSLYALIAYYRRRPLSLEAAIKYLVLAGGSSAFLLFGMALVYAELGTLQLSEMAAVSTRLGSTSALALAGFGLLIVGIGFKLALVPFHLWTPDVYQGAPAPVTAFVATVSKGAMFALLQRYFAAIDFSQSRALWFIFVIMAAASMLAGNLLALRQNNVKRLLAYSSIAHLGYLLVAFLAGSPAAVGFYLAAYFVTTLGAFGVVSVLSGPEREREALDEYRGLAWQRPFLAAVFTAMLLSLAGIPLTAGFIGKFYILNAGAGVGLWWLLLLLAVTSSVGLVYYLRVIFALYQPMPDAGVEAVSQSFSLAGASALSALALLLLWLGLYPAPLLAFIQRALATLR